MKASRLIEILKDYPDAEVVTYDGDCEEIVPVSGAVCSNETIELCTDSDDGE